MVRSVPLGSASAPSTRRVGRILAAAAALLVGGAAPSLAAAPTVTFSSDRGVTEGRSVAGCSYPKSPAPGAPATPPVPSVCGDGTVFGSSRLEATRGSPITVQASQPTGAVTITLVDDQGRPFADIATEPLAPQTFRFVVPTSTPASVYPTLRLRWEDEAQTGETSYGVHLVQVAPSPVAGVPTRRAPAVAPTSSVRLDALKRSARGARITLTASHAGRVRLTWRAGDRRRSRTVAVEAGRQSFAIIIPRRARRVALRATLLPRGRARRSTTATRTFRLAR